MFNYVERSLLSVVMPAVRRDLSLTNRDYGLAIHGFLVMYGVFYILGGRIADRLGYRRTFTLAVIVWSCATMAQSFVQGLRGLFCCQALLGIGEGIYYPAAIRAASELYPPASRAKAVGAILSAISLGMVVTPPLVAWTTLHSGWRISFLLIGALGLLMLLPPWLWLHRQDPGSEGTPGFVPEEGCDPATGVSGAEATLSEVLRTRKYWLVVAARGCSDIAWFFYLFWIPAYFQEVRGLSLARVGKLLWIPYFCSFLGAFAGAAASSALIRKGWGVSRSRKTVLLAAAFLAAFSASAGFVPLTILALALVSLALFAHQTWSTNIHTAITEISPPKHVAILYGISGAGGTFVGAGAQLVIGRLIDLHGYKPAFVGAGGMYILAAALLVSAGMLEPIRRKGMGHSPSSPEA
jgi:ACS family hexuronate transporter-like MFS transporter